MFVARDKDRTLKVYKEKPVREGTWWQIRHYGINGYYEDTMLLDPSLFPNLEWEDEPVEAVLKDNLSEQIIKETTQGITKKELIDLLSKYPDDATILIECCNVKRMSYSEKDNTIRID